MSGHLSPVPTRKFVRALKNAGFHWDRCNDGHDIYEKTLSVSVPCHSSEINGGLARRLAKENNLKI